MTALFYKDEQVTLWHGSALDVLRSLPDRSVDCCVTSPPYYGLRDYGVAGQYGLEASPAAYVDNMRVLFAEVRRVLATDGTLWLNLGDSYSTPQRGSDKGWDKSRLDNPGSAQKRQFASMREGRKVVFDRPYKNLLGMPWRVAFALQDDGWILRNAIIWNKPNGLPESVTDRLACRYEHVFMFSKKRHYWFDLAAIKVRSFRPHAGTSKDAGAERGRHLGDDSAARRAGGNPGSTLDGVHQDRNPGDVWTMPTQPFTESHFAVMPVRLAERCIRSGCKPGGVVLDPFSGSGTTGLAAGRNGRRYVGIDLNSEYLAMSMRTRLAQTSLLDDGAAS